MHEEEWTRSCWRLTQASSIMPLQPVRIRSARCRHVRREPTTPCWVHCMLRAAATPGIHHRVPGTAG